MKHDTAAKIVNKCENLLAFVPVLNCYLLLIDVNDFGFAGISDMSSNVSMAMSVTICGADLNFYPYIIQHSL